ncbi:MAG: hypothetical protein AAF824_24340 [Bacteroidota bacterium]
MLLSTSSSFTFPQASSLSWGMGALAFCMFLTSCNEADDVCTESYINGQLKFSVSCNKDAGEYEGEMKMFYADGTLMAIRQFKDGIEVDTAFYFHEDGESLKQILPFQVGHEHGESIHFYEDGTTREVTTFQKGFKHGPSTTYFPTGTPQKSGFFAYDDKYDRWTTYREDGNPEYVLSYYERELNGPFVVSRETGIPFLTGTFHRNMLDGEILYYNEEGAIIHKEIWNMGKNNSFQASSPGPKEAGPGEVNFQYADKTISVSSAGVSVR